ncbi:UAA transporter [Physocladia obscura]|uniref:UAA transporter n=1 Tax=Physocladia obscura TaxID=109957 RepID=A0AAD5T112_9FUNG|nr:UAA transporter [Physocladia obscura]
MASFAFPTPAATLPTTPERLGIAQKRISEKSSPAAGVSAISVSFAGQSDRIMTHSNSSVGLFDAKNEATTTTAQQQQQQQLSNKTASKIAGVLEDSLAAEASPKPLSSNLLSEDDREYLLPTVMLPPPSSLSSSPLSKQQLPHSQQSQLSSQDNKIILKFFHFKFPWLLTAIHSLLSYVGCLFIVRVLKTVHPQVPLTARKDQIVVLVFSVLYTVNIAVSNISLNMVSLPFHQIVRSTNPAVTIFLEWAFLGRWKDGVGRDVIFGVGMATLGEYDFTTAGFLATFLGTVLSSIKGISTNTLLAGNGLKFHPVELLWRMSGLSFLQCIFISAATGELSAFSHFLAKLKADDAAVAVAALENATKATTSMWLNPRCFSANKKVGALSIAVAGNVKQAMSLGLSVWIFAYVISFLNGVGILLTLAGGAWYSMIGVNKKMNSFGKKPQI